MKTHTHGCFVCGKPLEYLVAAKKLKCEICGQLFETNASCSDGHYVCDKCHAQSNFEVITAHALETKLKNPIEIAGEIMRHPIINMHGPEHHYLVPAVLLAAYKNAGGNIDLEKCLKTALERAKGVPGGICGLWGSCGSAVGSGIFVSILTNATPLSQKEWSV